ncbi:GTPase ObgE [Candidatus Berkelbacteria bacterium]|nr:GTPase ObgE [Candidatus Berkelbacteria bacterium]
MLVDDVTITVRAGRGGDGLVHFRREKYVPKGGPDGGDGGDGGDVWITVKPTTHTLAQYAGQKVFAAEDGEHGRPKNQHGKNGKALELVVPPGTLIWDVTDPEKRRLTADVTLVGERLRMARGGQGGWGNTHFATATHQTPLEAKPGKSGQSRDLHLELKLLADVGLIGLPNAGKSSLLERLTAAKPKVADYAFTTLEPNLGVLVPEKIGLRSQDVQATVLADIPGLVLGASTGKGLGDQFLRHIERTRVLVHLIDALHPNPLLAYQTIRGELQAWNPALPKKPELVIISKVDQLDERAQRRLFQATQKLKPLFISVVTGRGLKDLVYALQPYLGGGVDNQ